MVSGACVLCVLFGGAAVCVLQRDDRSDSSHKAYFFQCGTLQAP